MKTLFEIESAYAAALRAAGLDSFDAIMNMRGGPPASKHRHRETVPVEIAVDGTPKKFFLKRVFKVPPKHAIWPLFRGQPNISQPRNEWNMLAKLYAAGIPAMQRVAYGERRSGCRPAAAFILVEAVNMKYTLDDWLIPGFNTSVDITARQRTRLLHAVGMLIGRHQAQGFHWPDLHPKHIFARFDKAEWRFCIIDVERMKKHRSLPTNRKGGPLHEIYWVIRFLFHLLPLQITYSRLCHFASGYVLGYVGSAKKVMRNTVRWSIGLRGTYEIWGVRPRWNGSLIPHRAQRFESEAEAHVDADFRGPLAKVGLSSIDDVFAFQAQRSLDKPGLMEHRDRSEFSMIDTNGIAKSYFLKRYDHPPLIERLRHIVESDSKRSAAWRERHFIKRLAELGIPTMRVIAYGEEMRGIIEKRSFLITEEVPGESLEKIVARIRKGEQAPPTVLEQRDITCQLALLVRTMHRRRFFHRDLYLSHVFLCRNPDGQSVLHLIDLARMIERPLLTERWKIKDLAALDYSAPAKFVSRTDRIRFLNIYIEPSLDRRKRSGLRKNFSRSHKRYLRRFFISPIQRRVERMARHDASRMAKQRS